MGCLLMGTIPRDGSLLLADVRPLSYCLLRRLSPHGSASRDCAAAKQTNTAAENAPAISARDFALDMKSHIGSMSSNIAPRGTWRGALMSFKWPNSPGGAPSVATAAYPSIASVRSGAVAGV